MNEIQHLIRSLGIGSTYRGYRYLTLALTLCLENEDYLMGVSKILYPHIASVYQTSASSVERDLRTVIHVCWNRGNRTLLQEISSCPPQKKPATSEFLDILTNHLRKTLSN